MNTIIIFGAKYLIIFIVLIAGIYFFKLEKQKKKEMAVFAIITLPIIFLLSRLAGKLYFNPRPFVVGNFLPLIAHGSDNGFPSDHTLLSTAVAVVVYLYNKKIGIILGLLATLVGLARVASGVHHLADIFGSIMIAVLVTMLMHKYVLKIVMHKINK
ncbi:MAG: Bacitracin transport permease protein BCRC [uncultured bacterium]|nr:MAG: Bacitracin transport permease protein BCRC [uncultured bacterium]